MDYIANKEGDPMRVMLKGVIDEKLASILSYVMIARKFMEGGESVDKLVEEGSKSKEKKEAKGVLRRISALGRKVIGTQDFQMDGLIPRMG
jgi:hypothetical protein